MAINPPKSAPSTPTPGRKSATKPSTDGAVLPVTHPLDLWYLCQKVGYAEAFPLRNRNGAPMFQRTVTQWVRKDSQFFKWHFPYYGEVGFDMTQSPPKAIMSRKDPDRPSRMPLSQYEYLMDRYAVAQAGSMGLVDPLLSKDFLEDNLSPEDLQQADKMVRVARTGIFGAIENGKRTKVPGLLRIPDVIRVKDYKIQGAARYAQSNLEFVIEMKFDGDSFTKGQRDDYFEIAGAFTKLRLLEAKSCRVERGKRREWLEVARKTEPVFKDGRVSSPIPTARASALQQAVGEVSLLIGDIEQEQQTVRRLLTRH